MAELHDQLMGFAAHVRDPANHAAPEGIEDRRMAVYRELFFNSLESLLAGNFPVLRKTLGDEAWRALVRRFYVEHRCTTQLFTEVASEFVDWLASATHDGPEWLHELAQYEWVELALAISDASVPPHDPRGDVVEGVPVLSPFAWPLMYRWPVHRIGPDDVPAEPPDTLTLLLARRDGKGDIRFATLSPVAIRLLIAIDDNPAQRTGHQLLQALMDEMTEVDDPARFLADGTALLRRLHTEGTLLGTVGC